MTEPTPIQAAAGLAPVGPPANLPAIRRLPASRAVILCSGPLGIALAVILGVLITHSFNLDGYAREMWAATFISVVAGILAVVPLMVWMGRGAIAIVRLTMLAMVLRIVFMFAGIILATGPGWKLSLVPLVVWIGVCYLALLVAESGATAWVVRHG